MAKTLVQKVVVIAGATSGIGAGAAEVLAKRGARLLLAGRREALGQALAEKIRAAGGDAVFKRTDVGSDADVAALLAFAEKKFGGVDVVWHNAGIEGSTTTAAASTTDRAWEELFNTNVLGPVRGLRHGVPALERRGGGVIVTTSSVLAVLPFPNAAPYCASKAAVDQLTRVAAAELAPKNIRVYTINPYVFESEMGARVSSAATGDAANVAALAQAFNPSGRVGSPADIAAVFEKLVLGQLPYASGANIAVDAGASHFDMAEAPAKAAAKQQRRQKH